MIVREALESFPSSLHILNTHLNRQSANTSFYFSWSEDICFLIQSKGCTRKSAPTPAVAPHIANDLMVLGGGTNFFKAVCDEGSGVRCEWMNGKYPT